MRKSNQRPNNLVQDRGILKLHKQATTRSKNPSKKYSLMVEILTEAIKRTPLTRLQSKNHPSSLMLHAPVPNFEIQHARKSKECMYRVIIWKVEV